MTSTGPPQAKRDLSIIVDRGLTSGVEKIHGVHPIFLVEKIIRERILDSMYYKRYCFNLNLLTFVERASKLELIGTYVNSNNTRPTQFMCLLLKLLQLQPAREVLDYFLRQRHFKYLTALAVMYVRLTYDSVEIYETLEPLLADYRKLRYRNAFTQQVELSHMDEYVAVLLDSESNKFGDLAMPRLQSRTQLEEQGALEYRESPLQEEFEEG